MFNELIQPTSKEPLNRQAGPASAQSEGAQSSRDYKVVKGSDGVKYVFTRSVRETPPALEKETAKEPTAPAALSLYKSGALFAKEHGMDITDLEIIFSPLSEGRYSVSIRMLGRGNVGPPFNARALLLQFSIVVSAEEMNASDKKALSAKFNASAAEALKKSGQAEKGQGEEPVKAVSFFGLASFTGDSAINIAIKMVMDNMSRLNSRFIDRMITEQKDNERLDKRSDEKKAEKKADLKSFQKKQDELKFAVKGLEKALSVRGRSISADEISAVSGALDRLLDELSQADTAGEAVNAIDNFLGVMKKIAVLEADRSRLSFKAISQ